MFSYPLTPAQAPSFRLNADNVTNIVQSNSSSNFYFDQIKNLFDSELYDDVLDFSSWTLAVGSKLLNEYQHCRVLILCGESAYRIHEYYRADAFYKKGLQSYKHLYRLSPQSKAKLQEECKISTAQLKYKIFLCLVQCHKTSEGMKMLLSIPAKQRNTQINMAMGKIFKETGQERAAITCFREVVRACPTSLQAIENLLALGCNEDDINAIVRDKTSRQMCPNDWFYSWIRGTAAVTGKDHKAGISIFREIQKKYQISSCFHLSSAIGVASANYGDYIAATNALKIAHSAEPSNMKHVDLLSFLLWHEEQSPELTKLISRISEYSGNGRSPQIWIAHAYYTLLAGQSNKALVYAIKGSSYLGQKISEGLIAQGHVYIKLRRFQEAIESFRDAMTLSPMRYEPHRGITDCYMSTSRSREAITVAIGATKSIGYSPRIFTLCAHTLKKDPSAIGRAKNYLERALDIDKSFLPALFDLVDLYEAEFKFTEAIQTLKKFIEQTRSSPKLYIKLAQLMTKNNMEESAADQYAIALKLEPTSREARDGLSRLDPISTRVHEGSYEMMGDEADDEEGEMDDEIDVPDNEMETNIWEEFGIEPR